WSYLTFTQNYVHRSGFDSNFLGVTWSLAVEEQFYLFTPLAIFWLGGRRLLLFLLPVIVLGPVMRSFFTFPGNYVYAFCRTDGLFHEPDRAGDPMMRSGTEVALTLGALATTLVLAEISFRTLESRFIAFGRRWRYAVEPGQGLDVPAP